MENLKPDDNEISSYAKFMDFVCTSTTRESIKNITSNNLSDVQIADSVKELQMSISQVVQDEITEYTKDYSRDQLLAMLTEVAMTHGISTLESHPQYKMAIVLKLKLEGIGL